MRGRLLVVASVVAVVLVAGGSVAAMRFLAGAGPRPAEVLPSSTFAMISVDLDPSGGQKIEAVKTLRRLPSVRTHLGLTTDSDLVETLWKKTVGQECDHIDYAKDVKPWVGQRAALGGVTMAGKPVPAFALQVTDADAARTGFAKIVDCSEESGDPSFGWTLTDDYVVASDTDQHARAIVAAGRTSPLSGDADFQRWTEKAGGAGIANAYVSQRSVAVFRSLIRDELADEEASAAPAEKKQLSKALDESFKDFRGAGAALKFHDGGLELSVAGSSTSKDAVEPVTDHVGALPKDTSVVIASSVARTQLDRLARSLREADGEEPTDLFKQATGLSFPDDLATLLGSSLSLSLGGDAPKDLSSVDEPADVPVGLLVHGDDARIRSLVEKVEAHVGMRLSDLPATLSTADGKVAVASTPDYAKDLLARGSLADDADFRDAVPHAEGSPFVLFVSPSASWTEAIAEQAEAEGGKDGRELAADVRAFRALGMSAWTDGSTTHGLVRLSLR